MSRHSSLLAVVLVAASCAPRANLDLGLAADVLPAFDVASEPGPEDAGLDVAPPPDAPAIDTPAIDAPAPPDAPAIDAPAPDDAPAIDTPAPPDAPAPPDTPPPDVPPSCPGGDTRCGADCVDPRTSPAHCGGCGRACASTETCAAGVCTTLPADCRTGACPAGTYCNLGDGICRPGCIADTECPQPGTCDPATHACRCATATHLCGTACLSDTSPANCGTACSPCPSLANATATCAGGVCGSQCNAGYHRCGAACVSDASTASCGSACSPCAAPANATATCTGGACGFTCNAGWGNCDGNAANGCETNLTTSTFNCGACNQRCGGWTGSTTTCVAGVCGFTCNANYADCDRNPANGCEVDLRGSTANCGACGAVCPATPNSEAACYSGTCAVTCQYNFGNCDGVVSNGCEANFASNPSHCRFCGQACQTGPNGTAGCNSNGCTFTCATGFANCDGSIANGCEVDLRLDPNNCGMCNRRCILTNAVGVCTAGACAVDSCTAGYGNCDREAYNGCETNLNTSVSSCGACGTVCPGTSIGSLVTCTGGTCGLTCQANYSNCDGMAANGCEVDLRTNAANCGACGAVCPGNGTPGTTVTCSSRVCSSTCVAGWADCNGVAADGCEANLATSAGNCGACGTACAAGQYCVGRVCGTASPAPTNEYRYGLAATVALDGRVYVFGGSDGNRLSTVERYDPATNAWVYRAGLSSPLYAASAVTLPDGRLLCIGGTTGYPSVATRTYDTATDTWTSLASLQVGRFHAAAAVGRDGKVYVFGGRGQAISVTFLNSTAEVYDPAANTWTNITAPPVPLVGATALTTPDGRIYVFGGATDLGGYNAVSTVSIYNPTTNTWASGPSMPSPRAFAGGTIGADGRMYLVGGDNGSTIMSSVIALTPGATTYSTVTALNVSRSLLRAVTLQDGRIFAVGGQTSPAGARVESYTAGQTAWR